MKAINLEELASISGGEAVCKGFVVSFNDLRACIGVLEQ
jgi:bacteriocin-like protein